MVFFIRLLLLWTFKVIIFDVQFKMEGCPVPHKTWDKRDSVPQQKSSITSLHPGDGGAGVDV